MTDREKLAKECLQRAKDARVAEDYLIALKPDDGGEPLSDFLTRVAAALSPHQDKGAA